MNHAEYVAQQIQMNQMWSTEANFFFEALSASEFHWFFVQGLTALRMNLDLPAISSLLNGIESSVRCTMRHLEGVREEAFALSPYRVLSNTLLKSAHDIGLPVSSLAFPGEDEFLDKIAMKKPRIDVEIVRLRNNICHGNILEFVTEFNGGKDAIFTPFSVRNIATVVLGISFEWAKALGEFRRERGILAYGPTPPIPSSPLIFEYKASRE